MSRMKTLVVAGAVVAAAGCSDFLAGDKLDFDPNRPTSAQASQLFTAVQVNSYYIVGGHAARVLAMWTQQMAGTDRQYRGYGAFACPEVFCEVNKSVVLLYISSMGSHIGRVGSEYPEINAVAAALGYLLNTLYRPAY